MTPPTNISYLYIQNILSKNSLMLCTVITSVADPDQFYFGLQDPDNKPSIITWTIRLIVARVANKNQGLQYKNYIK